MEVCNLEALDFVQYWPLLPEKVLHITRVDRDREWFAGIVSQLQRFVQVVTKIDQDPQLKQQLSQAAYPERIVSDLLRPHHVPRFSYLVSLETTPPAPTICPQYLFHILSDREAIVEVNDVDSPVAEMEAETYNQIVAAQG